MASSSSPYSDDLFGNRQRARDLAEARLRIAKDGSRVDEAAALYSVTGQGSTNAASNEGQGFGASLVKQAGGVLGDALGNGLGSILKGKAASGATNAAMNTAWKTGFSMKGSLLG